MLLENARRLRLWSRCRGVVSREPIGGAPPPVPGDLVLEEPRAEEAPADGMTRVALGCWSRSQNEWQKESMLTTL